MNFPKRVLLIDDDEEEHYILTAALDECYKGIELIHEKNAKAALARLAQDDNARPDMVFLDWRMPEISGREILISLRKLPHYAHIPIVIFTGILEPAYLKEAKELGATFFLRKAFDLGELSRKLESLFSLDWKETQYSGLQL
jgi:CheY-like chemotaxis protein